MNARHQKHFESLQVGDEVAYAAHFVRTCQGLEVDKKRGRLTEKLSDGYVRISWNDEPSTTCQLVHSCNVAKPGTVAFSEPCWNDC